MTSQSTLGPRLSYDFSLRPPLLIQNSDYLSQKEETTTLSSTSKTKLPFPVSFLFRMFIACRILEFETETRFTALVLLHRYAQAKQGAYKESCSNVALESEDWPWIGAICLFLACKTEDEPRRLRDIINMEQMVLADPKNQTEETSIDNSTIVLDMTNTPPLDDAYWESKQKAVETEQMVLRWLGFDSFVSHPHRAVYWILQQMMSSSQSLIRDKILSISSQQLNDALFYPRALQWGVIETACASIDLAVTSVTENEANVLKTVFKTHWWTHYDISTEDFTECRKSLVEATRYLKSLDRSKTW